MMLNNIKKFGWLASASLLLTTTSCRDDTFSDYWDNSDEMTVTINVGLEGMGTSTRGNNFPHIGDGSRIDMLVYAVYYDNASDKDDPNHVPDWQAAKDYEDKSVPFHNVNRGYGQTILKVDETLGQGESQPITLTLKKGEKYRVVFWAQNHETEAFVIDDLKRVQMKYKVLDEQPVKDENGDVKKDEDGKDITEDVIHSINNDESRDAFCRSLELDSDQANRNITIYLRRPVAQINVGTRGFDFESITRNTPDGEKYIYSKIRINRAARYLNVVTDEIYTTTTEVDPSANTTEAFYTIDYEYEKIPAYWQMEVPEFPSYTIYDLKNKDNGGAYNAFIESHGDSESFKNVSGETSEEKFKNIYGKEEFLKVRLYEHAEGEENLDYLPYANMGSSLSAVDNNRTEEFKYLSMCYVLTNSSDEYQDVLTNVKVWVAKDKSGRGEVEIANLTQVPVQRNHRTNIVGNLLTAKAEMKIVMDQDFGGRKIYGENLQSGEIAEGFYYDAKNDEFQISSVNGLLFFQQLVNGNLTVRQCYNTDKGGNVGSNYPYYDPNSTSDNPETLYLKYKSHNLSDFDKQEIANIIMRGSKYYDLVNNNKITVGGKEWTIKVTPNSSKNWPQNNNFPFYGAKVKLMADLDLSGIEWIPIGFDCANWDTTFGDIDTSGKWRAYEGINYITLISNDKVSITTANEISLGKRRVFCGTFDGNGHTIYNLTTKKFGPNIHESAFQDYTGGEKKTSSLGGPYDCVQWFAYGLFGVVGPGAQIKDLRIQNVDIQGNNAVAGIVGQVSSLGFPAKIQNCVIDGGSIDAVPLYRGDAQLTNLRSRTNARGCYIAGIVGQFCAKDNGSDKAEITGCEVRNVTIQGYRRMGGIVGGIGDQGTASMAIQDIQLDIKIEKNAIRNSILLVNQYRPFNYYWDFIGADENVWMNGWGWGSGDTYVPMTDEIVGGYYSDNEASAVSNKSNFDAFRYGSYHTATYKTKASYYNYVAENNEVSNLQYCELSVQPDIANADGTGDKGNDAADRKATKRQSTIKSIPLSFIPAFSSLFVDKVILENNYYGETKLHTYLEFGNNDKMIWYDTKGATVNHQKNYTLPINFPNGSEYNYDAFSAKTGIYAESVEIDGINAPGGRSVITPEDIYSDGSCVMYITARDRKQFLRDKPTTFRNGSPIDKAKPATADQIEPLYKKTTVIKNVVLRGSPYAWAGILIAPNENMESVTLENVTIYDVYKTLAIQKEKDIDKLDRKTLQNYTYWYPYTNTEGKPKNAGDTYVSIDLNVKNCNFRGYTVPGKGWENVNYTNTTFEQGSETKYSYEDLKNSDGTPSPNRNEFRTVKIEANTTFTDCFFKAPFYIDLSEARANNNQYTVTFTSAKSNGGCYAASAYDNVKIDSGKAAQAYYIAIDKDPVAGKTIVAYYDQNQKEIE